LSFIDNLAAVTQDRPAQQCHRLLSRVGVAILGRQSIAIEIHATQIPVGDAEDVTASPAAQRVGASNGLSAARSVMESSRPQPTYAAKFRIMIFTIRKDNSMVFMIDG
jgi:hypothetical protein